MNETLIVDEQKAVRETIWWPCRFTGQQAEGLVVYKGSEIQYCNAHNLLHWVVCSKEYFEAFIKRKVEE